MDLTIHGTDDQLERYALGRLSVSDFPVLEEHLLVCEACRERLDEIGEFAVTMREALRQDALPAAASRENWFGAWVGGLVRKPAFSMALGFAALAVLIVVFSNGRTQTAPVATLELTAVRGEMPSAVRARETDLTLRDVPPGGGPFRVEVLDAAGQKVWSGLAAAEAAAVEVKVQAGLGPGSYFVRLYDAGGTLLHEYGFVVRP